MRTRSTVAALTLVAMAACGNHVRREAETLELLNGEQLRERAFAQVRDDPALPRVLLIGDSISIGYTHYVRELLREKANVHRVPVNAGPTTRGIEGISEWLGGGDWSVIHFNWGLHDLKFMEDGERQVSIEEYESNLRILVGKMRETGARLIWASTTPVPEGEVRPRRIPEDVVRYNAAAEKVMRENRVSTNDLYTFALSRLEEIQIPVNVHFTPAGSRELAAEVASAIRKAL